MFERGFSREGHHVVRLCAEPCVYRYIYIHIMLLLLLFVLCLVFDARYGEAEVPSGGVVLRVPCLRAASPRVRDNLEGADHVF
ncbi:hypothetical protein TRSC58_07515 [Trypanosoma rangeli SC58]|uniref:Uncharacterized protein n=1 Tax=Trypanosoma rangeli SC58 TaxID=429131 RepID=A0A061IV47_TRYRA|nr:hypothetical protein TRSC58_07515 [Trypanosoma rangeli SC58]